MHIFWVSASAARAVCAVGFKEICKRVRFFFGGCAKDSRHSIEDPRRRARVFYWASGEKGSYCPVIIRSTSISATFGSSLVNSAFGSRKDWPGARLLTAQTPVAMLAS